MGFAGEACGDFIERQVFARSNFTGIEDRRGIGHGAEKAAELERGLGSVGRDDAEELDGRCQPEFFFEFPDGGGRIVLARREVSRCGGGADVRVVDWVLFLCE